MHYTIANLPTLYRGRMYRSRLEARWAAFFDRLGWAYEYEPFDLGAWSPDFLLIDFDMLVEVKPLTEFDDAVADKMLAAIKPGQRVMITWAAPEKLPSGCWNLGAHHAEWHRPDAWFGLSPYWYSSSRAPRMCSDLASMRGDRCYSIRHQRHIMPADFHPYPDYVEHLWSDACNAVQWEPRP